MPERILLLAESEGGLDGLAERLRAEGYECTVANRPLDRPVCEVVTNGFRAIVVATEVGQDQLAEVARSIRNSSTVPLIVLYDPITHGAREVVSALEAGADDCTPVPLNESLLVALLRARLRAMDRCRVDQETRGKLRVRDVTLDLARRLVLRNGEHIDLTRKEFEVLATLALRRGYPVASADLLRQVFGYTGKCQTRTLEVHICRLRHKLEEDAADPKLILTVPRVGYRLAAE